MSQLTTLTTQNSPMTKIFVIGKLGEVVKKIFELEEALTQEPLTKKLLLAELLAYNAIFRAWPVEDKNACSLASTLLKIYLGQFRVQEKRLADAVAKNATYLAFLAAIDFIKATKRVKEQIQVLNNMGRFVGDTPVLEINLYAEMERNGDTDNPSDGYCETR